MDYEALEKFAEEHGIEIDEFYISGKKAMVVKLDHYHIAINNKLIHSNHERIIVLAHEIGHCETATVLSIDYFDNPNKKCLIRSYEHKATGYAYTLLATPDDIRAALKKCGADDWAIAEELDLDIELFRKIVNYYRVKGLLK